MTIYVHPTTITYLDYGTFLESVQGVKYSTSNRPQEAFSFEPCREGELNRFLAEKLAPDGRGGIEVEVGEEIEIRRDMNPHGLI